MILFLKIFFRLCRKHVANMKLAIVVGCSIGWTSFFQIGILKDGVEAVDGCP